MTNPTPHRASASLSGMLRQPVTLLLGLSVLLMGIGMSASGPYMPLFVVNELHRTPFHLGLFLTLNALSTVFVSAWLARRSDRVANRKPLVLLALSAATLALLTTSLNRSYLLLLLTGVVLFGTGGASLPQLLAFARVRYANAPGDLAERTVTILRAVFSLSWVIGPSLGAWLLERQGFTRLFLIAAGFYLASLLPLLWVSGRAAILLPPTGQAVSPRTPVPANQPVRPLRWVVAAFVLYGMSLTMSSGMYPLLVTKTIHLTSDHVGLLIGFTALLEIPFMFALVTWRRLPNVESLVVGAFALYAVYFVMVVLAQGLPALLLAQAVRALVIAVLAGLGMTYFQQLMPGQYAVATTLFMNTTNIGAVVSGVVAGGFAQAFGYRAVFILCALLTFAAWGVMQVLMRREPARARSLTGMAEDT